MKKNVVREHVYCCNGVHVLIQVIRKGDYLIPMIVKVVDNNEQKDQKENAAFEPSTDR